ncbi:MAG: HAD family hydrolase [Opitutales bacterium]
MTPISRKSRASKYEVILWDNDGVLVDTERLYFEATRSVFHEQGVDLTMDLYFEYFLEGSRGTSRLARERGLSEDVLREMQHRRGLRYQEMLEREDLVIDGVRETLESLKTLYPMSIVTSAPREYFDSIHSRTGLLECFEFVIARGDYANSKPAPDPYLTAIERCGLPKSQCLAIEDSPRGLAAAQAAGIECWIIPNELTRRADFSAATRVLESISEVPNILLS